MILYEGVDLAYNIVRLGYNSVTGVYSWYYQTEAQVQEEKREREDQEEQEKHDEAHQMIKELKLLNERIKELEDTLVKNQK